MGTQAIMDVIVVRSFGSYCVYIVIANASTLCYLFRRVHPCILQLVLIKFFVNLVIAAATGSLV
jgi:hypothetical protein